MYTGDLNTFGKNAPAVSLRGKAPRDDSTLTPGPGAYQAKVDSIKLGGGSIRMS